MEKDLSPDDSPAGAAPVAVLFGFLPRIIQDVLKLGIDLVLKVVQFFGKALEDAMRDPSKDALKKEVPRMGMPLESYSTHASFDHVRRIERLEDEMASRRGGFRNKVLQGQVEQRLVFLEKELGIKPKR
ncbi:MAG: hypothetical protein ACOY3I_02485 [Verrucomicrobiota bacterium]